MACSAGESVLGYEELWMVGLTGLILEGPTSDEADGEASFGL